MTSQAKREESVRKGFTRLMLLGKVGQAIKLINSNSDVKGVYKMNEHVRQLLNEKHPEGMPGAPEVMTEGEKPKVESVIYEAIDAEL